MDVKSRDGGLYDRHHCDPRLFFCGAPSSFKKCNCYAAGILKRARNDAINHHRERNVRVTPLDTFAIRRTESVVLPDGRQYVLSATWLAEPGFLEKKSVKLQFPDPEEA